MAWIIMKSAGDDFSFVSWKVDGTLGHKYEHANELARKVTEAMKSANEKDKWMFALLDILDGSASAHDIHYNTGLSMERCEEISKMFYEATKDGWPNRD